MNEVYSKFNLKVIYTTIKQNSKKFITIDQRQYKDHPGVEVFNHNGRHVTNQIWSFNINYTASWILGQISGQQTYTINGGISKELIETQTE